MKTLRSFVRTYSAAFGLISLPFIILLISSYWILVNSEVIVFGLTFSVLSSFAIAYRFRQYEKTIIFTDENLFVNNLINSLGQLGYSVKNKTAGSIEFEPRVYSHLLAGKILIHFADNSATIQGSRLQVRKGLALTFRKNNRPIQSNSVEEYTSEWAEENKASN